MIQVASCLNLLPLLLPGAACGSMRCKHGLRVLGSAGARPELLGLAYYNVDVYVAQMPSCAASSMVLPGQAASITRRHVMTLLCKILQVSSSSSAKAASEQWDFNSTCCSAPRQLAAIPAGHIVGGARSDLLDSAAGAVTAMSYSSQWDTEPHCLAIACRRLE